MKLDISSVLKAVTGATTGSGAGTLTAAGALQKSQGALSTAAEKLGAKLALKTGLGGNLFASLAKGAQATDTANVDALVTEETGYSATQYKTYALYIVLAVGAYFLFKKL